MYYYGVRYYDPRTSIWQGVDPKAGKMPGWSPYVSSFDNPVKFLDPDGLEPTPAEAAKISAHVYGDKRGDIQISGGHDSKGDFKSNQTDKNGLRSQLATGGGGKKEEKKAGSLMAGTLLLAGSTSELPPISQ